MGNYIIGNKKRCINNLLIESKNIFNSEIEESIKGKKAKFNIVSVGRLDKLKNYPQSIKAISKLIYESIDIKLFIFGIGDQYQEINNLAIELGIEKNIVFMNRVEEPFLYFEHFDLLLQTSKHESFPNSIVEALSENLYVVSTDVGDVQILLDNKRGSILKNDDPQIIADTIKEKIFDDNPRSIDGKKFIQDYLNNSKTINEWEKLILF